MIHLEIKGKLKTSIEELKNVLQEKMNYEPRINLDDTNELNIKGYIGIGSSDRFDENDILRILTKHCSEFIVNAEEDDFDRSHLFSDFIWDGNHLVQHYKTKWGTIDEVEDWNWIIDEFEE